MKTYKFDIPFPYIDKTRISDTLSLYEYLTTRVWDAFNDDKSERIKFLFEKNDVLYISTNGTVETAHWAYVSKESDYGANAVYEAIVITIDGKSSLFKIEWLSTEQMISLKKENSNEAIILIEQNNDIFPDRTIKDIKLYLDNPEAFDVNKTLRDLKKEWEKQEMDLPQYVYAEL